MKDNQNTKKVSGLQGRVFMPRHAHHTPSRSSYVKKDSSSEHVEEEQAIEIPGLNGRILNIENFDKVRLLQVLHSYAKPYGVGKYRVLYESSLSEKDARLYLKSKQKDFLLGGKLISIDLNKRVVDVSSYIAHHGLQALKRVVEEMQIYQKQGGIHNQNLSSNSNLDEHLGMGEISSEENDLHLIGASLEEV